MKKCIVSFADSAGYYRGRMARLEQSLKGKFDGDFIGFTDYKEIGCETHREVPYKFKPYSIARAQEMGYDLVLWCDSPVFAIKNIQPVFDHLENFGYVFFDNIGHSIGDWSNEKCLEYFSVPRDKAMGIKMIMACCMGFNFAWAKRKGRIREAFRRYKLLADPLFPGSWDNHRHDQTVMSLLIHKYNLNILNGQQTFFAYESHYGVLPIADSVCLITK